MRTRNGPRLSKIQATACVSALVLLVTVVAVPTDSRAGGPVAITFTHVVIDSFPPRNQHAKTVGDIDGDGFDDVLTSSALVGDGLYWYAYPTWSKHTIVPPDSASFGTEMQVGDIDNDGDLDVIIPKRLEETVWWYENPRPLGDPATDPWVEHYIGSAKGHDLELGDVDGDGRLDAVVREDSTVLFVQNPSGGWSAARINDRNEEGLALGDIDLDGDIDVAINGYWLENPRPGGDPLVDPWNEYLIDASWPTRVGVRVDDVNGDARPDVVLVPSESANGRLSWYDAPAGPKSAWVETVIDDDISYVHTFKSADVDLDGDLDLVTAEMEQSSDPDEVSIYFNQGGGLLWTQQVVATTGSHNLRITDIGRDGDIDIIGANWNGQQLLEMWRNDLDPKLFLDTWQRHVIDAQKPWRSIFVATADLDRDGLDDIVTGGWWYRNPGSAGGVWARDSLGAGLQNMACVHDLDDDGDLDILGTRGQGAQANDSLVWARNDGTGFTVLDNIETAAGDFLQGVAVVDGLDGAREVFFSWHDTTTTLQQLSVPGSASLETWPWSDLAVTSQHEALSAGDIDRDGDTDLLQGTRWLRNDSTAWTEFALTATPGIPDRNRLADVNRDGRLDAVVGFQAVSVSGRLAWYEQGAVATDPWVEHVIANVVGPMSVDAVDMDGDGDIDVVVGEHNLAAPETASLYIFENVDGSGGVWTQHTVYTGDEHHDGARVVDIDRDGDMDVVSIGWSHDRVVIYENLALTGGGGLVNDPPVASLVAVPTSGDVPLVTTFDASASFDPDGDALSWTWDFGDGSPADTGSVVVHTFDQSGIFNATVTVSDGALVDVAGVTVTVGTLPGPTAGLIHHWRFDDGQGLTAVDSAGGADGTLVNGPGWDTGGGRIGGAIRFDGTDDRVDVGSVDVVSDSGLTLALWFKADDFGVYDARFITKATGTATGDHFWMLSTIDETALRFRLKTDGTTDLLRTGTGQIEAGRWYHVAATYDGSAMRIYRDGEEVASMPKTGLIDTDSTVLAAIGNQPPGAGNLPFDGRIDDVRIYNRALTPAEIDSLVTYRIASFTSGNGTVVRSPSQPDYVVGDTVTVTAVPATNWSFSGWSGGLTGTENPDTIVVVSDTSLTATFVQTHFALTRNIIGSGAIIAAPDTSGYALGDTVVLTAVPDSAWSFSGWSGAISSTANPVTIVIDGEITVTATFMQNRYALERVTAGSGVIDAAPDTTSYAPGDTIVLSAQPDSGWVFHRWEGALSGSQSPDTLVMPAADTTVTAVFRQLGVVLTEVVGNGQVSVSPDTTVYLVGDTLVVTALADSAWSFAGWSGDLTGAVNPDTLVLSADTTRVTATFMQGRFALSRLISGSGSTSATPDSTSYAPGDTIVLSAIPDSGWVFHRWEGALSGAVSPDTLIMPAADTTVTAVFAQPAALVVDVNGEGTVAVDPDSSTYLVGDTVVVTATPDSAWSFAGWSGDLTGVANPDTLVLLSDTTTVTATFVQDQFSLDITMNGSGSVIRNPDFPAYAVGDTVILTAVPDSAWSFYTWSGDVTGSLNPDTVVVDSSMSVVAIFEQLPTGVDASRAPAYLTVLPNYPNPFGRETTIRYGLPADGRAEFEVYNVRGQLVYRRTLERSAGWHELRFSSGDPRRGSLSAGVYFYRLRANGASVVRKMVLVR